MGISNKQQLRLVYASKSLEDVLLGQQLQDLARRHPERLQIRFLLGSENKKTREPREGGGEAAETQQQNSPLGWKAWFGLSASSSAAGAGAGWWGGGGNEINRKALNAEEVGEDEGDSCLDLTPKGIKSGEVSSGSSSKSSSSNSNLISGSSGSRRGDAEPNSKTAVVDHQAALVSSLSATSVKVLSLQPVVSKRHLKGFLPPPDDRGGSAVLVCGPPGMMAHLCGEKKKKKAASQAGRGGGDDSDDYGSGGGGLLCQLGYSNQVVQFADGNVQY
jgi:hypothetical protein